MNKKKCPHCGKFIQGRAIYCRYCKKDLPIGNSLEESITTKEPSVLPYDVGTVETPQLSMPPLKIKDKSGRLLLILFFVISTILCFVFGSNSQEKSPSAVKTPTSNTPSPTIPNTKSNSPSTEIPIQPLTPTVTPAPTFRQINWMDCAEFLVKDHTNWNTYDQDSYNDLDYSIDLVENAKGEKFKAWIIKANLKYGESSHYFVAIETSDKGIVYIEPQEDYTYSHVMNGNPLCDDWGRKACLGVIESFEYLQCDQNHLCTIFIP